MKYLEVISLVNQSLLGTPDCTGRTLAELREIVSNLILNDSMLKERLEKLHITASFGWDTSFQVPTLLIFFTLDLGDIPINRWLCTIHWPLLKGVRSRSAKGSQTEIRRVSNILTIPSRDLREMELVELAEISYDLLLSRIEPILNAALNLFSTTESVGISTVLSIIANAKILESQSCISLNTKDPQDPKSLLNPNLMDTLKRTKLSFEKRKKKQF